MLIRPIAACIAVGLVPSAPAQLVIHLQPATVSAFEHYAAGAESSISSRWHGQKPFLEIEEHPGDLKVVLAGGFSVRAESPAPVEIPGGLVHDWVGSVFFPGAAIAHVLNILQDFNAHKNVYPQVADSNLIKRNGNDITGFWRLQQKGLVPVSFDVEQVAHYQQVSPGKWAGRSYARNIVERNSNLFARGRPYPLGQGHGYLWRLYAYWSLESTGGGVLAECRTLSLSRDIPEGLAWAVAPFIQKMPQDSLTSTLEATRTALSAH